ncbi:MAG: glycosyltransferase [Treponema sp.]|jgi:glycosyltransferase involved in cell wall biosynthesis|nr:glycosyltransferase [Treponema sp.]
MNEVLVSIIVPIHNSQRTLERTLVSLKQQTWHNIEVIMVNDGSTDHSAQIAAKYEKMDRRFILINQLPAGVSEARNNGLMHAAGKYILFSDSDDWLKKNAVETYVSYTEQNNADLTISWFYRVIGKCIIPRGHIGGIRQLSREQFAKFLSDAPANFYYGVVWNKCYRRDIILNNQLFFSGDLAWCEDELFNLQYLQHVSKITAINIPLYYYVKRADSICESQLNFRKAFTSKYEILGYYRNLYKSMDLYKENRLKINSFMFAVAKDTGIAEYHKIVRHPAGFPEKIKKSKLKLQQKTTHIST